MTKKPTKRTKTNIMGGSSDGWCLGTLGQYFFRERGLITKLGVNSKRASIGYHMSDFGLISAFRLPPGKVAKCQNLTHAAQQTTCAGLLDHLVGEGEQ